MKTLGLFILFIISNLSYTQSIFSGSYVSHEDSLVFNKNRLKFSLKSNGGVTQQLKGAGEYEVIDDFLIVKTGEYPQKPIIHTEKSKDGFLDIFVGVHQKPEIATIKVFDKQGKLLATASTGTYGKARIKDDRKIDKIVVSSFMKNDIVIRHRPDYDYRIENVNYKVLENKILVFKILEKSENILKLILLTTDYQNKLTPKKLCKRYKKIKRKKHRYLPERVFLKV